MVKAGGRWREMMLNTPQGDFLLCRFTVSFYNDNKNEYQCCVCLVLLLLRDQSTEAGGL